MTFLRTHYRLVRPLAPRDLQKLSGLSTVYGIRGLDVERDCLVVDYDASRIHEADVLAALRAAGIGAEPEQAIPLGAFDHTGEFRDFAWPIQGLSPANQKTE
jgi:hypothetical protein